LFSDFSSLSPSKRKSLKKSFEGGRERRIKREKRQKVTIKQQRDVGA